MYGESAHTHDNKLKSFGKESLGFLEKDLDRKPPHGFMLLMNSFLAEHFGHSLPLCSSSSLFPRLSPINKRGGIAGFSLL